MSKYEPLTAFLRRQTAPVVRLEFADVEAILGFPLPRSAYQYPEWWSNNVTGHSHARSWVEAGWRAEAIDRSQKTLVFRHEGSVPARRLARSDIFGRMKGSVVVKSGADLTEPTGEAWNAERGILHE